MRRGLGRAVFNSNNSGNPYYLYNCIVDDIWTTTAKTARRAVFAARGCGVKDIVLTGNLTDLAPIRRVFESLQDTFGVHFIIPENAQFGTVIGAALYDE